MKIFISGGISGVKNYKKIFKKTEKKLLKNNFHVMNPAILPPTGFEWEDYMKITISMLSVCDAILMLNAWEKSKGAKEELKFAKENNIHVFFSVDELLAYRKYS